VSLEGAWGGGGPAVQWGRCPDHRWLVGGAEWGRLLKPDIEEAGRQ
jgi:hypothetical protein